jgi:hypothetical protein
MTVITNGSLPPFHDHETSGRSRVHARRRFHRRTTTGRRGPSIVLVDDRGFVTARCATVVERVATVIRSDELDRELARGAAPESCATLAIRAQQLVSPRRRHELATALARILIDARTPAPRTRPRWVPLPVERVGEAVDDLQLLKNHLEAPVPVAAQGVAISRLLICDAGSPLYRGADTTALRRQLELAIRTL